MTDQPSLPTPQPDDAGSLTSQEPDSAPRLPPARRATGGLSLAALVVGILAMVMAVIPVVSFIAFVPAIAAAVLGLIALIRHAAGRGRALTGLILGAVALVVAVVVSLVTIVAAANSTATSVARSTPTATQEPVEETPEATPSEAPSAKPTPEAPPVAAVPADAVYSGFGDSVIQVALPDGPDSAGVGTLTHDGSSNFAVWSLDTNMAQLDLLVNTIGSYQGTVPLDLRQGDQTTALEITADGNWTVTLHSLQAVRTVTGTTAGVGDDVFWYSGKPAAAQLTNDGDSNFAVWSYGESSDLLVNEIGPYSGTVRWPGGTNLVVVNAVGNWGVTLP